MKHKKKKKLAGNMISVKEIQAGKSIWDSKEWNKRREARARKQYTQRMKAENKRIMREGQKVAKQHYEQRMEQAKQKQKNELKRNN